MNTIDVKLMREMFLAGANALDSKKDYVNELNVFPVPDGDTGTNMMMTLSSAVKEVTSLSDVTMADVCKAISSGSLRGARGNSGVILSQLLRGFTKQIRDYDVIDCELAAAAFDKAVDTAYKAVMKPKEGTILTVAKGGAEMANYLASENLDMVNYLDAIVKYMREVLNKTPEMLPVLKEAGVVDSGGEGLVIVLEGALALLKEKYPDYINNRKADLSNIERDKLGKTRKTSDKSDKKEEKVKPKNPFKPAPKATAKPQTGHVKSRRDISTANIKFGYCTEFIVVLETEFDDEKEEEFKLFLQAIGDSIVLVSDDEIVKVHVHTNMPGIAIQKGLTYGSLTKMKIDNMREEHNEVLALDDEKARAAEIIAEPAAAPVTASEETKAPEEKTEEKQPKTETVKETEVEVLDKHAKAFGFITVSAGEGLPEIFAGLAADVVIEGGQTMNPSTEDMLNAIETIDADNIFIMPNNSNIILAATQAKNLVKDKNIIVIPSKTVPQGIMAMLNFMENKTAEENEHMMVNEMKAVKSGSVTYSIRDTVVNEVEIKQGDIMGIGDKGIMNTGSQVAATTVELVDKLLDDDSELVTLYYGKDTTEDEANLIAGKVEKAHPDIEVEVHYGGQPVYYYYVSVE